VWVRRHADLTACADPTTAIRSRVVGRRTTLSSMPESRPQATPSDPAEVVLVVDTHKEVHVAAVLTTLGVHRMSRPLSRTLSQRIVCSRLAGAATNTTTNTVSMSDIAPIG